MSVTIPIFTAIPDISVMNESEYNAAWNTHLSEQNPFVLAANALAAEAEVNAARAESAVSALANAAWASGTYTAGDVVYSPIDFLNYRCKTTGSRTTDPSLDPPNWELITSTSVGGADTTSSAVDITLTATSGRLQSISMAASSKKVTLPSAVTLKKGTPLFVFKNSGLYRFSVHKNGGGFLCYVSPGQGIAVHCSDNSTGAGVWHVSGQDVAQVYGGNTAEVLNVVDSRYLAVAMLSSTQAICAFRDAITTYLNAVVLNSGSASGTPAAVNAEASLDISIAAQTSSQATVVYKTSTGVTKGYVLDISGATFTPGAVRQIDAGTGGSGTSITALSAVQLLCMYQGSAASTPRERVLDISASAITESSEVEADSTTCLATHLHARKVSATKVLVAFRNSSANKVRLRLQSISGSTPAPTGSVLDLSAMPGTSPGSMFGLSVQSSTRAVLVAAIDRTYADLMISLLDISGSSPVLLRNKTLRVNCNDTLRVVAAKVDANTAYAAWTGGGSLGVDAITIKITADDDLIIGNLADKLEASVELANGYLACDALDATHVMQVCRNSSTYLSAKTIELAA